MIPAAWPYVLSLAGAAALLLLLRHPWAALPFAAGAAGAAFFFRDPERMVPQGERLALSADPVAHGRSVTVSPAPPVQRLRVRVGVPGLVVPADLRPGHRATDHPGGGSRQALAAYGGPEREDVMGGAT